MKILQIHKHFYVKGGASRYFLEVSKLLKNHGHEVAYFSMHDKNNTKTKWSKYFVKNISYEKVEFKNGIYKFFHLIYSLDSREKISILLDKFKPDVVHIHSIYHHISPSIIWEIKKRGIPIVQTLHDYHLIAPSHTLFHNNKICEISKKRNFFKTILHKCIKDSYLASFVESIEQYINFFTGVYVNNVDVFIAPSNFLAKKCEEYGIKKSKLVVLHNFTENIKTTKSYNTGKYVLYFGRLSPEKGLSFLMKIASLLPNIPFKIAGSGLEDKHLKNLIRKFNIKNVDLLGYQSGSKLKSLIIGSKFVIIPSLGYEIFPMSALEAFSLSKPIVASNIGGLPELMNGNNGLLFKPGNENDCINVIEKLWNNKQLVRRLGKNAFKFVNTKLSSEIHYRQLLSIYEDVIKKYTIKH